MKLNSKSGATLAAAAATLFLAGSVVSTVSTSANAAAGKCMAGNACKGQSACKGSANACKGQNACKGRASRRLPKRRAPPWAPSSSRADRSDQMRRRARRCRALVVSTRRPK